MKNFRKKIHRFRLKRIESKYRTGYIAFVRSGGLYKYRTLLNAEYQKQKIDFKQKSSPKVYCHLTTADLLINTNDYYYQYILNSSDTIRKISWAFHGGKAFSLPLPKEWILFFKLNGYQINSVKSKALFLKNISFLFCVNLVKCSIHIFRGKHNLVDSEYKKHKSAFVFGMTPNSVSIAQDHHKKFTYTNWIFENMYIDRIYCDIKTSADEKLIYSYAPVAFGNRLRWFSNLALTIFYAIKTSIINFNLIVPNIINFTGFFLLVSLNDRKSNIEVQYYIFTNSFGVFRPIWCQDRMSHDEYVLTLPYSVPTNLNSPFDTHRSNLYSRLDSNNMFLSSKNVDALFRNNSVSDSLFNIYFMDSQDDVPQQLYPTIAVFDYEAPLGYFGNGVLNDYDYYDINVVINFLNDILEVASDLGFKVLHKTKRNNLISRQPEYSSVLLNLNSMDKNIYEAFDSNISPIKLMKNSFGVISLPISSPSFIAKSLGYSSIFYDPTSCIKSTDPLFKVVDLVSGKKMLKNYIERNFKIS